jgi:hypothetical protein
MWKSSLEQTLNCRSHRGFSPVSFLVSPQKPVGVNETVRSEMLFCEALHR